MAGAETSLPAARFLSDDIIERGRENTLRCPVYQNGSLVAPDAGGTVIIYDQTNTVQLSSVVTISGSIAQVAYTPAVTLALSTGWRIEWTLTINSVVRVFRNEAALVRHRLYPCITGEDLFRLHPDLDPAHEASAVEATRSHQPQIDEAFADVENRLLAMGNRPNLVMTPSAFREFLIYKALEIIWRFEASTAGENSNAERLEVKYEKKAETAWDRITFSYDDDDDGQAEEGSRRNATPSVWLQ